LREALDPSQLSSHFRAHSPDLCSSILARVDAQVPFVDDRCRSVRRWAKVGFSAAALGLVATFAIAAVWMPDALPWTRDAHRPLTTLVRDAGGSARASLETLRQSPARLERLATAAPAPATTEITDATRTGVTTSLIRRAAPLTEVPGLSWAMSQADGDADLPDEADQPGAAAEFLRRADRLTSAWRTAPTSTPALPLPDAAGNATLIDQFTGTILGLRPSGPQ
jgi:hypothetical protein